MFSKQNSRELHAISAPYSQGSIGSTVANKSAQFQASSSKLHREDLKKRIRQTQSIKLIAYERVSFKNFYAQVEEQANPYSILKTVFTIASEFTWRQYITHLQILMKKFTNFITHSNGRILEELSLKNGQNNLIIFDGYLLQERIESMIYLSDKTFQNHLLILIHSLIAYNKRYALLDESSLSENLLCKHHYENCVRQEVFWLLTRMSLSCEALRKVMKIYLMHPNQIPLLAVVMILSHYIYEEPSSKIEQLIQDNSFQQILQNGLFSSHYETERETVLIFNNIVCKSMDCAAYVLQQTEIKEKIGSLQNQESEAFRNLLWQMRKNV